MVHPLQDAFDRVDRAAEHIEDFRRREATLGKMYHEALTVQYHDKPPHNLSARADMIIVDSLFGILLGETCYNLRAAMDYLVFELARKDSGTIQKMTQFPICDSKERFRDVEGRFLTGVNTAHRTAIEALQPYSGCDWTPILRDISNPDKHCRLPSRKHGFMIRMSTMGPPKRVGDGALAPIYRSKRRAMHPIYGREMDVYLATEVPIMVDVAERPKPVTNQVQELLVRVRETLKTFEPEF